MRARRTRSVDAGEPCSAVEPPRLWLARRLRGRAGRRSTRDQDIAQDGLVDPVPEPRVPSLSTTSSPPRASASALCSRRATYVFQEMPSAPPGRSSLAQTGAASASSSSGSRARPAVRPSAAVLHAVRRVRDDQVERARPEELAGPRGVGVDHVDVHCVSPALYSSLVGANSTRSRRPTTCRSRRTGPDSSTRCLIRLRFSQVRMNPGYASKSLLSMSIPAASKPYISAWLSVVPRPHSGSRPGTGGRASPAPTPTASSVTLSSSLVNCSLVLPAYFWMVIRSSSNRSSGCSVHRAQQLAVALEQRVQRRQVRQQRHVPLGQLVGLEGHVRAAADVVLRDVAEPPAERRAG